MLKICQHTLLLLTFMGLNFLDFRDLQKIMKFNTSCEGKRYVTKGWEKVGVAGVVNGETALPPEDPFEEIDNVLHL